ncbi:hypothetical protein ACFLVS_00495 [Chloroflexota bacterium]
MWQNIALALIGLGILILIGWSAKVLFMADDIPIFIRIASGIVGAGALVLIGVAIKDRLAKAKTENFEGVDK